MSLETAKKHLSKWNRDKDVFLLGQAGDTVEMASKALGVSLDEIAKSMSFYDKNGGAILIVTAGTSKVDNRKFKDEFGLKAKMIAFEEVEPLVGHPVGGVGPFGVNPQVKVYLDQSLKKYDIVYPCCGSNNSAIKVSIPELEQLSECEKWVDVTRTE